jgi:hypothetical protein
MNEVPVRATSWNGRYKSRADLDPGGSPAKAAAELAVFR